MVVRHSTVGKRAKRTPDITVETTVLKPQFNTQRVNLTTFLYATMCERSMFCKPQKIKLCISSILKMANEGIEVQAPNVAPKVSFIIVLNDKILLSY